MRISVTDVDIRNGIQRHCRQCPLATAITRATGRECEVHTDHVIFRDDRVRTIPLPVDAQVFRHDFDAGESVEAFEFDLEIPGDAAVTEGVAGGGGEL